MNHSGVCLSTDGRTLIPGDPAALHSFATGLSDYAAKLSATGDSLKGVNSGDGWSGEASQAFRRSLVPGRSPLVRRPRQRLSYAGLTPLVLIRRGSQALGEPLGIS